MDTLLQVMICTYSPGASAATPPLQRVAAMELPAVPGVGYVISCQSEPAEIPQALRRHDVAVHFSTTRGLSNNRNAALSLVTAPYALVCDDDVTLMPEGLQAVIDTFETHPDLDIAAFRYVGAQKPYPPAERSLADSYRGYSVSSIELALRMDAVRRASLSFSPLMGIGSPVLACGEENLLVLTAMRRGLCCRFYPLDIAIHDHTTSTAAPTPGALRSQGAYIALAHPWTAPARLFLTAWRRRPAPLLSTLVHLINGYLYALKNRRSLLQPNQPI